MSFFRQAGELNPPGGLMGNERDEWIARQSRVLQQQAYINALQREADSTRAQVRVHELKTIPAAQAAVSEFQATGRNLDAVMANAEVARLVDYVERLNARIEFIGEEIKRVRKTRPEEWRG